MKDTLITIFVNLCCKVFCQKQSHSELSGILTEHKKQGRVKTMMAEAIDMLLGRVVEAVVDETDRAIILFGSRARACYSGKLSVVQVVFLVGRV